MDITLKLTDKQMDILANALGQRPYVEVAQLLQQISQQVQAQQQPPNLQQQPYDQTKPNGSAHAEAPA